MSIEGHMNGVAPYLNSQYVGVVSQDIETLKEEIAALKKENAMLKTKIEIVADVAGVRFIQIGKASEFYATARTKVDGIQEI